MKLFSKEIDKKLFSQYSKGSDLDNQVVVTKIFNPYGKGRWFLLNSDPDDPDYLWAIVQMGDVVEMGGVLRSELESVRVTPFRFPLERDLSFRMVNAGELFRGLQEGKFYKKGGWVNGYAKGGMTAGRWYKDNNGVEYRYVGEDSLGNALFSDGEKVVTKSYDDFDEKPKENKLFGFFEEGGEMNWGEDLGGGFSIGNDVRIIDPKSLYQGRTGYVSGLIGKDLLVTILENGNERNVIVSKKGAQKLDAPEFAKGGGIYSSDSLYYLQVIKDDKEVGKEKFRAKSLKEAKQIAEEEYEEDYIKKYGNPLNFIVSEAMKEGGKLIGNQKKLDVNKNGKLDAQDFKMLRGKMAMGGEIDSEAKRLSDNPNWTNEKLKVEYESLKKDLENFNKGLLKPSKVIGTGYKSSAIAKRLAKEWLEKTVEQYKKALEIRGVMAMGGKVKFADKVKAIKESLLKRKKVSPKVQKDYGKTYSPKEAEESAKRIVGARVKKYEVKKK